MMTDNGIVNHNQNDDTNIDDDYYCRLLVICLAYAVIFGVADEVMTWFGAQFGGNVTALCI